MISELQFTNKLGHYDRNKFDCGVDALNRYLQTQASQDVKKGLAVCYLSVLESQIVGFYTLTQHSIEREEFETSFRKKIPPTYAMPATLIGRLAVARKYQGKGIGNKLLMHALGKINQGSSVAGTAGAVVVAKHDSQNFYLNHGFVKLLGVENKYFLPIKVIHSLFTSAIL